MSIARASWKIREDQGIWGAGVRGGGGGGEGCGGGLGGGGGEEG